MSTPARDDGSGRDGGAEIEGSGPLKLRRTESSEEPFSDFQLKWSGGGPLMEMLKTSVGIVWGLGKSFLGNLKYVVFGR